MNKAQARRMAFTEHGEGTETVRGKGMKKETWYSICSTHMNYNKNCPRCDIGSWRNAWLGAISGWFHDNVHWLWYFWINNI